jgi:hypothetical protein
MKRPVILLTLLMLLFTAPAAAEAALCSGCQSSVCGTNPDLCVENACPCESGQPCVCPQTAGTNGTDPNKAVSSEDEDAIYTTQGFVDPDNGLEEPALVGEAVRLEAEENPAGGTSFTVYVLAGLVTAAAVFAGMILFFRRPKGDK